MAKVSKPSPSPSTEARVAAISKVVGQTLTSHHKPQGLVRLAKGSYSLKVSPKGKAQSIERASTGQWTLNGKGSYSTRGEAFLAAHKVKLEG